MTKEEVKKLYEGKFFYEIVKSKTEGPVLLFGPFDNIYYVNKEVQHSHSEYEFIQVIDGTPRQAFTENEILVTDRRL